MTRNNDPLRNVDPQMRSDFPELLAGEMSRWTRILTRQFERIIDLERSEEERRGDLLLFPLCLRAVLRIARLALKVYGTDQLRVAINEFNAALPDAVKLRNVLEHYDDYLLGEGNLQSAGANQLHPAELAYNTSRAYILGPNPTKRTCILSVGGLRLDTREATMSAVALASIVMAVVKTLRPDC